MSGDKETAQVAAAAEALRTIAEECPCVAHADDLDCADCYIQGCPAKHADAVINSFPERALKMLDIITEAQMLEDAERRWQSAMDSRCPEDCDRESEAKAHHTKRIIQLVRELAPIGAE